MREIKFRVFWHKDKITTSVDTIEFLHGGIRVSDGCYHIGWQGKDCELREFTGLHDKNGKEIYEGDILEDNKGKVYEIVWGHDLLWLAKTNEKQGNCYCPKGLVEHGAVVAGNRWDNPELLKEGSV